VLPFYVTDLESDLIGGLFGCDLYQVNEVSSDNNTFLDLVFTNAPVMSTSLLRALTLHC
jgi:hypothetical protein